MKKKKITRDIKKKKGIAKYFKIIIKKGRYENIIEVNKEGIPVLKGTDVPVSIFAFYSNFLRYYDEELLDLFHLKMNEEQIVTTRERVTFFSIAVLEFPFEKRIQEYYDQLYKEEMLGYSCS